MRTADNGLHNRIIRPAPQPGERVFLWPLPDAKAKVKMTTERSIGCGGSSRRNAALRTEVRKLACLSAEEDYPPSRYEIYRHVREGEKVVAVVSALAGETDALLDQGSGSAASAQDALVARLARIGELHSRGAAGARAGPGSGLRACTLDPHEMGLVAEGDPLDSDLIGLDAEAVLADARSHDVRRRPRLHRRPRRAWRRHARPRRHRSQRRLLRRPARRPPRPADQGCRRRLCRRPGQEPDAERFCPVELCRGAKASAGLIQPKAIRAAQAEEVLIEVACLGSAEATPIGELPRAQVAAAARRERLRVALLGCGAVGAGVLTICKPQPELFEIGRCWCASRRATGPNFASPLTLMKRWRASRTSSSEDGRRPISLPT